MKLWKKVSAMVAMAAMCVTLAVPVTASAEVDAHIMIGRMPRERKQRVLLQNIRTMMDVNVQ